MANTTKITKEMILDTAFSIARREGLNSISNRRIAKELNSSIRPIYYQFKNTEELKLELGKKIDTYFYDYLLNNKLGNMPLYKQIGINYIRFSRDEKKLFKILFMSDNKLLPSDFILDTDYMKIKDIIRISTNLSDKDIKSFHLKMWLFTHGIATLSANDTILFTDKQISDLLSYEFQALMLLEENPDNKWVLKEEK
ncbi:MAG: TetR/AcrR family transcriptional regulator [Erysipelotrichaceae bacterium]|nr:TetR/AcrR family transcriptional regulator [Erysipelotrichaceae bacterium]